VATKKQKASKRISKNISKFSRENIPHKQAIAKSINIEKQRAKKRRKK